MTFSELLFRIDEAPRYRAATLERDHIPPEPGIYVWFDHQSGAPIYVGKGSGVRGLRARIWGQHLNPKYLEGRPQVWSAEDAYQLSCPVLVDDQPRIDKSVFRRNLGRRYRLPPGQGTVDHIRTRCSIAWVVLPVEEIVSHERALIVVMRSRGDLLNIAGNRLPSENWPS